jgi:hypothetical protein
MICFIFGFDAKLTDHMQPFVGRLSLLREIVHAVLDTTDFVRKLYTQALELSYDSLEEGFLKG